MSDPKPSNPPARTALELGTLVVGTMPQDEKDAEFRPFRWSIARRLLSYMWRHKALQRRIVFYGVLLAVVHSLVPEAVKQTVALTIEHPETWRGLTGLEPAYGLWAGAGSIFVLGLAFYLIMRVRLVAVNRLGENVVFDIRHDLFRHVQTLDMSFFDRTRLGRVLSRGTGDVASVRSAVVQVIPRTIIHVGMGVFALARMFSFDWPLALALCALGPALYFGNTLFDRHLTSAYRVVQESFSRLTANIAETVSGIRVTQAFAREGVNAQLFEALCADHTKNNMRAARVHGMYIPFYELSGQVAAGLILLFGGWRVAGGHMGLAELIGFLLYTGNFFMSVIILADLYNVTLQAMAGAERIFALLDTKPAIVDSAEAEDLPRSGRGADIEFRGVTFGYTPERAVLHDVSFQVPPGTSVALVGHTGSGKTSIVSLVTRLYAHPPGSGEILIDGRRIEEITLASLHSQTGLVLQDNFLFAGSVRDNIRFARPTASDEEVRSACEKLGCLEVFEALPRGLDSDVGERGGGLSLGQRQLVTFARAMLADPRILMLDEATSAVDTFTEHRIQLALEQLMEGRTCLIVAHRLSTVRRCDQILVLDHGRVVERGGHAELLAAGGRYAELYREFVRMSEGEAGSGETV
ncbi:MAG: ABC transporter ATP-binding protein [Phycisphaerales bacterium]